MTDVSIKDVETSLEIMDSGTQTPSDIRKLLSLMKQHLQHEQDRAAMRNDDGRLRDRAWQSDVKPE
jgi:hypothetical protein